MLPSAYIGRTSSLRRTPAAAEKSGTHLPHGLDALLEEMIVRGVGQIIRTNEMIIIGPKLLHRSKGANLFDVFLIVFLRPHALQAPVEPECVRVLRRMMALREGLLRNLLFLLVGRWSRRATIGSMSAGQLKVRTRSQELLHHYCSWWMMEKKKDERVENKR